MKEVRVRTLETPRGARGRWGMPPAGILFLHALALVVFLCSPLDEGLPSAWPLQGAAIIAAAAGLSLFSSLTPMSRAARASLLFVKVTLLFVVCFPRGADLALHYLLLSAFTAEFLVAVDRLWWTVFLGHAAFIAFLLAYPARAWGTPVVPPRALDLGVMEAVLVAWALAVRRYLHFARDLERREATIASLERSVGEVYRLNADFFSYAADVKVRSTVEERRRVSRDIHDIMGYTLVNLRVMLEVAIDLAKDGDERLRSLLRDAADRAKDGLQESRRALRELRRIDGRVEPWCNRVLKLARTFGDATGVGVEVGFGNVNAATCPRVSGAVYQFVQEALTNSFKHGRATRVRIGFWMEEGALTVRVFDNGVGAETVVPGIGFSGIAERFEGLGGNFSYRNMGDGFEVVATVPVEAMRRDA